MASSNAVLSQIERLLLDDPSTQSPIIHLLRSNFPDELGRNMFKPEFVSDFIVSSDDMVDFDAEAHDRYINNLILAFMAGYHYGTQSAGTIPNDSLAYMAKNFIADVSGGDDDHDWFDFFPM